MKHLLSSLLGALSLAIALAAARGGIIALHPIRDTSIYSESDNSNAQGALYAGQNASGMPRRALLAFDIAANIPAGATITSATLDIRQTKIGPAGAALFAIHPLSTNWGEGASFGTGAGNLPTTGDATWNFSQFDSTPWTTPGGDFGPASGTALLDTLNTVYTFTSQPAMVADVQRWLNLPNANFGWILRAADEAASSATAREFASRELGAPNAPTLTVTFTVAAVPEPASCLLLGVGIVFASLRRPPRRLNLKALPRINTPSARHSAAPGLTPISFTSGRLIP